VTAADLTIATRSGSSWAGRIALAAWLLVVILTAVALAIQIATDSAWVPNAYGFPGFTSAFGLSCGTVGAIVLSRRPSNLIGRLLLVAAIGFAFQSLYTEYGIAAYLGSSPDLPFREIAAWLVSWAWMPPVFLVGPVVLSIFPDGRLLSWRWGLAPAIGAIDAAVFMFVAAFTVGPINNFGIVENPFGFVPADAGNALAGLMASGLAAAFVVPAVSLVIRYRRSDPERRLQLKWIAVAGVVLAAVAPLGFSIGKPGQIVFILAFCGVPIATGIAVLRYRLYEIDTIINRALVYGLLTAIIAGIYTASIGVMQRLSSAFLGGSSEATIVVTTVVIVSAFTPIKTRLQALVDRRFKDAGDARLTFEAFTRTVHERTWAIDSRLLLRRFAEVAVSALRAASAEIELVPGDGESLTVRAGGDGPEGEAWSAASTAGGVTVRLRIRQGARELSPRDAAATSLALDALATELADVR
jgi:hypothetical protein